MRLEPLKRLEQIIDPRHTALIIVDMQYDFCSELGSFAQSGLDVSEIRAIIPPIQKLLAACRKKGVFVVHIQQTTLPNAHSDGDAWLAFKTRDGKNPEYAKLHTRGWEIVPELAPLEHEVCVMKYRPSSFHGTFLDQILRANGIRTVLVAGERTEGCIMATVLDASFCDYYTCVVEDCVASSSRQMSDAAMTIMRSRYRVLPSAQIIDIWESGLSFS